MTDNSRMDAARRRVRIARNVIVVVAAGAFVGGAAVVRAAHPGTHGHSSSSAQAPIPGESSARLAAAGVSGSSLSPAPAASAPVAQSSGS